MSYYFINISIGILSLFNSDSIELSFNNKSIDVENGIIRFEVELKNNTNIRWLLPGFGKIDIAADEEENYCSKSSMIGSNLFLFTKNGERIYPTYSFGKSDLDTPFTKEDLVNSIKQAKEDLIKSSIILEPNSKKTFSFEYKIELNDFDSKKISLYFLYQCSKSIYEYQDIGNLMFEGAQSQIFIGCFKTKNRTLNNN